MFYPNFSFIFLFFSDIIDLGRHWASLLFFFFFFLLLLRFLFLPLLSYLFSSRHRVPPPQFTSTAVAQRRSHNLQICGTRRRGEESNGSCGYRERERERYDVLQKRIFLERELGCSQETMKTTKCCFSYLLMVSELYPGIHFSCFSNRMHRT